jgi:hypothetical protein
MSAAPTDRPASNQGLDASLRGYLETNADIVIRITKPVRLDDVGALSAQSDQPILFENIVERPGFRLCDILVKNRRSQARALGVEPKDFLRTLAFRLRQPPRGLKTVKTGPVKEVKKLGADADWTALPIPLHKDKDITPYVRSRGVNFYPPLRSAAKRGRGNSNPVFPFEPEQRQRCGDDDQRQRIFVAPGPIQLRHVLEIHAVDADYQYRRNAYHRRDGQHLHDVVLVDVDDARGGVLQELHTVDHAFGELDQRGDVGVH